MAKKSCCLCNNILTDAENAPILTLGNSGWPRCVCPDCEGVINTATLGKDYDEIHEACRRLGDGMIAMRVEDTAVIEAVNDLVKTSMQRADEIKAGTYDFSQDEVPEENGDTDSEKKSGYDIPEELRETEEDRALDAKEARAVKIIDKVTGWLAGAILVGAIVFFLLRFVF